MNKICNAFVLGVILCIGSVCFLPKPANESQRSEIIVPGPTGLLVSSYALAFSLGMYLTDPLRNTFPVLRKQFKIVLYSFVPEFAVDSKRPP